MCDECDFRAAHATTMTEQQLREEYARRWRHSTAEHIARCGQSIMSIEGWPPFSYTVGLWGVGHPELVVYGLEPRRAGRLLNEVADWYVHLGRELHDGEEIERPQGGGAVKVMRIPRPQSVVIMANNYFRRRPANSVRACQLVYPDVHGTWPWEASCHLFPGQQPIPGATVNRRRDV